MVTVSEEEYDEKRLEMVYEMSLNIASFPYQLFLYRNRIVSLTTATIE